MSPASVKYGTFSTLVSLVCLGNMAIVLSANATSASCIILIRQNVDIPEALQSELKDHAPHLISPLCFTDQNNKLREALHPAPTTRQYLEMN